MGYIDSALCWSTDYRVTCNLLLISTIDIANNNTCHLWLLSNADRRICYSLLIALYNSQSKVITIAVCYILLRVSAEDSIVCYTEESIIWYLLLIMIIMMINAMLTIAHFQKWLKRFRPTVQKTKQNKQRNKNNNNNKI